MTNKEILEKAIQKAIDGGFVLGLPNWYISDDNEAIAQVELDGEWLPSDDYPSLSFRDIIYLHEFANALWNEEPYYEFAEGDTVESFDGEKTEHDFQITDVLAIVNWQYHLQQMVIAEDPIKYLGQHI